MAHKVKCLYCCASFDADTEDFVKHGNRYAHRECAERIEAGLEVKKIVSDETPQRLIDLQNLKDYINELYHKQCNWQMIMQQIKKFEAEEYTLSGMQKTLYYWYEVKKNPVSKSKQHIGIIPYAYPLAQEYFKQLYEIEQKNKDKINCQERIEECIEIKVREPEAARKKLKFFDIGE